MFGPEIDLDVLDKIQSFLARLKTRWSGRLPGNFVSAKTVADVVIVIAMFVFGGKTPFSHHWKYLITGKGHRRPIHKHLALKLGKKYKLLGNGNMQWITMQLQYNNSILHPEKSPSETSLQ